MKFIVSSSLLLKNLQSIIGVINTSNTLPILDDFLFDLKDDELTITSSDLETTMSVTIKPTRPYKMGALKFLRKYLLTP